MEYLVRVVVKMATSFLYSALMAAAIGVFFALFPVFTWNAIVISFGHHNAMVDLDVLTIIFRGIIAIFTSLIFVDSLSELLD